MTNFKLKGPVKPSIIAACAVVLFVSLALGSGLYKNVGNQALVVDATSLATAWQPSLNPASWNILYSPGMSAHPSAISSTEVGWSFYFPQYPGPLPCANEGACSAVHYITSPAQAPLSGVSITLTGRIEEPGVATRIYPQTVIYPKFQYQTQPENTCISPASYARLLIQRAGDNLTQEYYRWWSNPIALELKHGAFSVTVNLSPGQWSDVYGKEGNSSASATAGFLAALTNVGNLGMTFGGGCFFGHGVNISAYEGTARFVVTGFKINR